MTKQITYQTIFPNFDWTCELSVVLSSTSSQGVVNLFYNSGSYGAIAFIERDINNPISGTLVFSSSDVVGGFNSGQQSFFNGKRWYIAGGAGLGSTGYKDFLYFGQMYEGIGTPSASMLWGPARASILGTTDIFLGTVSAEELFPTCYGQGYYSEFKAWGGYVNSSSLAQRIYDAHSFACEKVKERKDLLLVHILGVEDIKSTGAGAASIKNRALAGGDATASGFAASSLITTRVSAINYISEPEVPNNVEKVRIHNTSKRGANPVVDLPVISAELSPYSSVNKDISRNLPTVEIINDCIGTGIERYRDEYRQLEIYRNSIFNRYREEGVDINAFFDACKFLDMKFIDLFKQFIPANVKFLGAEKTVESHALERNKVGYRFNVYHTPPTLQDDYVTASCAIEGNYDKPYGGDVVVSASVSGLFLEKKKEIIDVSSNMYEGKFRNYSKKEEQDIYSTQPWDREDKSAINVYSRKRPLSPLSAYHETECKSSVLSPDNIVCLNNALSFEEVPMFERMNKKPSRCYDGYFEARENLDVYEEDYVPYKNLDSFGGNSGVMSFRAMSVPVVLQNDVVIHMTGSITIEGAETELRSPTGYFLVSGVTNTGWGKITLWSKTCNIGTYVSEVNLSSSYNGFVCLRGRVNTWDATPSPATPTYCYRKYFQGKQEALRGEDDFFSLEGEIAKKIALFIGLNGALGGAADVNYDLEFHFDRAIPFDKLPASSLNSDTLPSSDYGWCGTTLAAPTETGSIELFWKDKYDFDFNGDNMNMYNLSFGKKMWIRRPNLTPIWGTVFAKNWNGQNITSWMGWGHSFHSSYEEQYMGLKDSGVVSSKEGGIVQVKRVGSTIHCAWPDQNSEDPSFIVKRPSFDFEYAGFWAGEGFYPGKIIGTTWKEGPEMDVSNADHATFFFYAGNVGSVEDTIQRYEIKFMISPAEGLPFVQDSVSFNISGGLDLSDGSSKFDDASAGYSKGYVHAITQQECLYRKEVFYDSADPNFLDSSWMLHKNLKGIAKIKMLVRGYAIKDAPGSITHGVLLNTMFLGIVHLTSGGTNNYTEILP